MADNKKNFSYSIIITAPSPATTGTTLVVETGGGILFPTPPFNVTIWPPGVQPLSTNAEIVRVTNITDDTFTIEREQEETTAISILSSFQISATITKKTFDDYTEKSVYDPDNGSRQVAFKDQLTGGAMSSNVYFTTIDSDISGYKKISYTPEATETELIVSVTNQELLARTYLYDNQIDATVIETGSWYAYFTAKVDKTLGVTQLKYEAFLRHIDNTETTLFSVYSDELNNTGYLSFSKPSPQPTFSCATTDRFGVRIYVKTTAPSAIIVNTIVGNDRGAYFNLPILPRHNQLRTRDASNCHPASAIQLDTLLGTPTYTSQNDFNNSFGSTGRKTGGYISKGTGSTVNVASGTGFLKVTDDDNAQLIPFDWSAVSGIAIPSASTRYIGVDYNSGAPEVVVHTTYDWNLDSNFPLGRVVNDTINSADEIYIANAPWWVTDGMTNTIQAIRSFGLVRRDESVGGIMLSVTGTRNIAVTGGVVWVGFNDLTFDAIDTSASGTIEGYWYSSTGGWQASDLTQYSVTQWNDVTQATLQTITTGKYCNVWIYGELTDSTPSIALLYPQALYNTPAQAEATSAPTNVPNHIKEFGTLIGRIIIKQGTDTPISVQSVFTNTFSSSVVTDHANLSNLAWNTSGHTGTANNMAVFNSTGVATYKPITDFTIGTSSHMEWDKDVNGNITNVDIWTDASKTTKLYTITITFENNNPTVHTEKDEILNKTLTTTMNYSGSTLIIPITKVIS